MIQENLMRMMLSSTLLKEMNVLVLHSTINRVSVILCNMIMLSIWLYALLCNAVLCCRI